MGRLARACVCECYVCLHMRMNVIYPPTCVCVVICTWTEQCGVVEVLDTSALISMSLFVSNVQ